MDRLSAGGAGKHPELSTFLERDRQLALSCMRISLYSSCTPSLSLDRPSISTPVVASPFATFSNSPSSFFPPFFSLSRDLLRSLRVDLSSLHTGFQLRTPSRRRPGAAPARGTSSVEEGASETGAS